MPFRQGGRSGTYGQPTGESSDWGVWGGIKDAWGWLNKPASGSDPSNAQLGDKGYMSDIIKDGLGSVGGRQAPGMDRTRIGNVAQMDQGQSDQWRRRAIDLANQYGRVASGQEAGAGELGVNRQRDAALANQMAMQAGQRGSGAAMAGRTAARTSADIGQQSAGMAAESALADQMAARQALGQLTGQQRGMDINIAAQNMSAENQRIFQQAGLDQARNLAEMEAKLRQTGMNDAMITNYLSQLFGINNAEMQARLQQEATDAGRQTNMQQIGGMVSAAGGLLGKLGV